MSEFDQMYREVILDHYKNPRNKRDVPSAPLSCSRNNPLCGDEITVYVDVVDDKVVEVAFQGQGCSISQASASMMTESLGGRSVVEAGQLVADFRKMMAGELEPDEETFGELVAMKGVVKYPIRVKCAVLSWDVFQEALESGSAAGAAAHP